MTSLLSEYSKKLPNKNPHPLRTESDFLYNSQVVSHNCGEFRFVADVDSKKVPFPERT